MVSTGPGSTLTKPRRPSRMAMRLHQALCHLDKGHILYDVLKQSFRMPQASPHAPDQPAK
jgi:hypothetical protein